MFSDVFPREGVNILIQEQKKKHIYIKWEMWQLYKILITNSKLNLHSYKLFCENNFGQRPNFTIVCFMLCCILLLDYDV